MEYVLWILLWLVVGTSGFIFWWIKEYNLTTNEVFLMCACALCGPFSWIIGLGIHESKNPRVLIKCKNTL